MTVALSQLKKGWFQGEFLTSSPTQYEPFSDAGPLNWVKVYNAVRTPMPIHMQAVHTDIFSTTEKKNALPGIEPAAPLPSQSPSRDVNPLHQSTTLNFFPCFRFPFPSFLQSPLALSNQDLALHA